MPGVKPTHFTYEHMDDPNGDLRQGDIVQPSGELRTLLSNVHPHFTNDKYIAFLVLTQSCDLARRASSCKSRYINLAVVRPLVDMLSSFLDKACEEVRIDNKRIEGLYISETKQKAEQLLARILNQNAQAEGLFYLHPDTSIGITECSVALLQVTVAVRAHEHYDKLVRARSGRLKEQFQSKLGWLIGNLFSRVATPDWDDDNRKRMIREFLAEENNVHGCNFRWVPRKRARAPQTQSLDVTHMTRDEIVQFVKRQPGRPKELGVEAVLAAVQNVTDISPSELNELRIRLTSDSVLDSVWK